MVGSAGTPPPDKGGDLEVPAGEDTDLRPGPIALPPGLRGRSTLLGWIVSVVVIVLAVVVYFTTRPAAPQGGSQAPPSWGSLTLTHVVLAEARAAGDAHPTGATWLFTHRNRVLPVLSGGSTQATEADYVVTLQGRFHAPPGLGALPGSSGSGSRLVLLVSAFDGSVTGWFLSDSLPPGLAQLGVVHPLRLGGL